MDARSLLIDTHSHMPAVAVLDGLSAEDALRHVPGMPHSIAGIVAHMEFWQNWFLARVEGRAVQMAGHAAEGWPESGEGSWPIARDAFVAGLERIAAASEAYDPAAAVVPAMESPLLAGYTNRDVWEHLALHNAHHLGQIVVLRQMMNAWPPPSGSYTW